MDKCVAMVTISEFLDYSNISHFWCGCFFMYGLLGVPSKLLEQCKNDHFYKLWVRSSNSSKYWAMATKIFYIAIYSTGECSEVQHFQVVDPETNSVDALIFQRVTKCYNLLCSINRIKNELLK